MATLLAIVKWKVENVRNELGDMCCVVLSHSFMSDFATPWTIAHQVPLSIGILQARQLEWVAIPSSRLLVAML